MAATRGPLLKQEICEKMNDQLSIAARGENSAVAFSIGDKSYKQKSNIKYSEQLFVLFL